MQPATPKDSNNPDDQAESKPLLQTALPVPVKPQNSSPAFTDGTDQEPPCLPRAAPYHICMFLAVLLLLLSGMDDADDADQGMMPSHPKGGELFSPDCLLPLGGGLVGLGGGFPTLSDSARCKPQIVEYFREGGPYYTEVSRVGESAIAYFTELMATRPATREQVIVFDIDETALSNAVEWMGGWDAQQSAAAAAVAAAAQAQDSGWLMGRKGRFGCAGGSGSNQHTASMPAATTSTATSAATSAGNGNDLASTAASKPQVHDPLAWRLRVSADDRPALEPTLRLYHFLYASNYSVAFITGRKEEGRRATAANLEAAGYGRQCPQPKANNELAAEPSTGPCYVELHLRDQNDNRLASVYKPDKRKQLADHGYTVVGNIGDQFSDLEGLYAAPASFKLPNPVYYIL